MSTAPVLEFTRYKRLRDSSSTMSEGVPPSRITSPKVAPVVCGQHTRAAARKQMGNKDRLERLMAPGIRTADAPELSRWPCKLSVKCVPEFVKGSSSRNGVVAYASNIGRKVGQAIRLPC